MSYNWTVFFVVGGPGARKGTQCKTLAENYQLCHLSIGDILRAELNKPSSQYASIIQANMAEGRIEPPSITVALLKAAMIEEAEKEDVSVFLVDGFPRKMDQAELFESTISAPFSVIFLNCPQHILRDRLLSRAKVSSRLDDGVVIMQTRFETFSQTTMPVITHYKAQNRVIQVDASRKVTSVY
ncbi:adenylate kinase-domain-containing protein [Bisporella sp. PMI_857]|nr:adenylate kinase-domain-containing protein [Bisporella sp. PMI_857]